MSVMPKLPTVVTEDTVRQFATDLYAYSPMSVNYVIGEFLVTVTADGWINVYPYLTVGEACEAYAELKAHAERGGQFA